LNNKHGLSSFEKQTNMVYLERCLILVLLKIYHETASSSNMRNLNGINEQQYNAPELEDHCKPCQLPQPLLAGKAAKKMDLVHKFSQLLNKYESSN
jgi:hypothetical protein